MKTALVVFLVALAARGAWGAARWSREGSPPVLAFPDEQQYWGMAASLRAGDGLRDELGFRCGRMPIYPAFLSVLAAGKHGVAAAQAAQWLVGAVAAAMLSVFAGRWGRGVGAVAGLLVAVDPFLVFSSSLLLTETMVVAALIALWLAIWLAGQDTCTYRDWIAVGVLAGLCVLIRESSLGLVAAGLVWLVAVKRFQLRAVAGIGVVAGFIGLMLLPWAVRNHQILGEWRWLTTRGGISLYDGVGPEADGSSDLGDVKQSAEVAGLSEAQWDAHFQAKAWESIRQDPVRVVRLAGVKLARMWNPLPNVESHRSGAAALISAAWAGPIFLLAMLGAVILIRSGVGGWRSALFLLLPAIYLSLLHSVFVGSVRYRLPAMPFLEILAAIALVHGAKLLSGGKTRA